MGQLSALIAHVVGELAGDNVFVDLDLALGRGNRQRKRVFLACCSQFAAARGFTFHVATSGMITAYRARGFATLRDIATEIGQSRQPADVILLADPADFNFEALQQVCHCLLSRNISVILAGRTNRQVLSLEGSGKIFKIYGRCQQPDPDGQPCQTPAVNLYESLETPLKEYGLDVLRQMTRIATTTLGLPRLAKALDKLTLAVSVSHWTPPSWLGRLTFGFMPQSQSVRRPLCSNHLAQRFNLRRRTLTLIIGPPKAKGAITALRLSNLGKSGTAGLLAQERGGGIVFTGLDKGARNIDFRFVTFKVVDSLHEIVADPQAEAVVVDEFHLLPANAGEALSWSRKVLETHDLYLFCPLTDVDLRPFESVAALALASDRVINYDGQCVNCDQTAHFMTAVSRDNNRPTPPTELKSKGWPRLNGPDRRAYDIVSVCLSDHPATVLWRAEAQKDTVNESVEAETLRSKADQYRHERRLRRVAHFSRIVGSVLGVALILPASYLPNLAFALYLLTIIEIAAFVFWYENRRVVSGWALGMLTAPFLWVILLLAIGLAPALLAFLTTMFWFLINYIRRLAISVAAEAREMDVP